MQVSRFILFPFAVLYHGVTALRNKAFDWGLLKQQSFQIPVIAVGNLSTGGTGKTPMIEYLIKKHADKRIAVLSRGYGRSTKGYRLVSTLDRAALVGDEPLQIKNKFGDQLVVAVCENRVTGIATLLKSYALDFILLDDAFQHRYVKASQYILLISYDKPYFKDYVLPAGNLRESRQGARRAHCIVVTKCPDTLTEKEKKEFRNGIKPLANQQVYFAGIVYAPYVTNDFKTIDLNDLQGSNVYVVTGIAKPEPFVTHLRKFVTFEHKVCSDHHLFTEQEVRHFSTMQLVITTEKDYMRLKPYRLKNVFYLPMETFFIGEAL